MTIVWRIDKRDGGQLQLRTQLWARLFCNIQICLERRNGADLILNGAPDIRDEGVPRRTARSLTVLYNLVGVC